MLRVVYLRYRVRARIALCNVRYCRCVTPANTSTSQRHSVCAMLYISVAVAVVWLLAGWLSGWESVCNNKLSCRREAARCFMSLNISTSHLRSLKIIRNNTVEYGTRKPYKSLLIFHCNYHVSTYRTASRGNGHNTTVTRSSLECCTQTQVMIVTNLPRPAGGAVFITPDSRTVDSTR